MQFSYRPRNPTKHYDENVRFLDEQLCELIAKRKSVSNDNPGFPPIEQINIWAEKFGLYENFLHSVFYTLYNEHLHRPRVEPAGFRGITPVMRLVEVESRVFWVTHLRQYENATVLFLQIDSTAENQSKEGHRPHIQWELSIGPDYDCYASGGSGNGEQWTHQFVVSPRLPDDVTDISFKFSWRKMPPNEDNEDVGGEVILK